MIGAGQRRVVHLSDLRRGLRWQARVFAAVGRAQQCYVAEVPRTFTGWLRVPYVTDRPYHRSGRGRGRATPRLRAGAAPAHTVESHLNWSPDLKDQNWKQWHVKETEKGPMVWETKHVLLTPKDENGLPAAPLHLIAARNVCDIFTIKYFVSNAPSETPVKELLHVAFSRWRVERCFEDQKTELGFDHFEGRSHVGLKRHQAITAVSHLFLSETRQALRGEKSGADSLPSSHSRSRSGPLLGAGTQSRAPDSGSRGGRADLHTAAERPGTGQPHAHNPQETRGAGRFPEQTAQVWMEELAL